MAQSVAQSLRKGAPGGIRAAVDLLTGLLDGKPTAPRDGLHQCAIAKIEQSLNRLLVNGRDAIAREELRCGLELPAADELGRYSQLSQAGSQGGGFCRKAHQVDPSSRKENDLVCRA